MFGIRILTGALLTILSISTTAATSSAGNDIKLHDDIDRISTKRIFFGHQSVGFDLLKGIKQLATTVDIPIKIVKVETASGIKSATISHMFLPENGKPLLKLKKFEEALEANNTNIDIALMKFCFIDFNETTDAKTLFDHYQSTINKLKVKHPEITFVHITTPLHIVEGGLKAKLKYWMGIAPLYGTFENLHREEYNNLLRQAYQGHEPFFDIAHFESLSPEGKVTSVSWKGNVIPVMTPEYSTDGGHLNNKGNLKATREFISVLASIPKRNIPK